MEVKEAITNADIISCWPIVSLLHPHVKFPEFLPLVRLQQEEGYHLIYISETGVEGRTTKTETELVSSVLGYTTLNLLYCGKTLYISDLCTLPEARQKGQASALLDWIIKYAREQKYDHVTLDSPHSRHDAHRLFYKKGFQNTSHHFTIDLTK